ncbi:MAG: beta-ketoacyl-ACP synthase [Pseudorhodoplanes sp.]|uniref:beta-ketoacyl-ACP synthase n=1 Tax=Pseudorhodoplanes sp. TaxID=1934341 RepID=UPI003D0BC75E
MSGRQEVWITGTGLVSALGEGLEQHWQQLMAGGPPPYDDTTFAPYITFPTRPINFDTQIPKKGDQRQMESWQRIGVYAAGLALTDAGIAKNAEILDKTDMIVAAGGGERDVAVDAAILTDIRTIQKRDAFVNERLMSDLRPTLFLAQLPNLLAGNISLVHGVVGSSRTFMGEEASGADALRVAHARIAAGQSDISLVGGAYNGTRWDLVLLFRLGTPLLEAPFRPVWDRGPAGALALAAMGAFVVLESRAHAEKRGARPVARLSHVESNRNPRRAGDTAATLLAEWQAIEGRVKRDSAVVISGASGAEPATSEEHQALEQIGLPVRATTTYIGNGMEAQFLANIAIGCQAVREGTLFPPCGSGDAGESPSAGIRQALVTNVGHWRGEGLALIERID